MTLQEAIENAHKKRDNFVVDAHILCDENGEFFTVLDFNLKVMIKSDLQKDKEIYYTAWNLKK